MISPVKIESAKDRLFEVLSSRIELKRSGASWKARCPFHDDSNPSLTVSERRRAWRCFVCNTGGDTLDFLMKFHNTDFYGALRLLGIADDDTNKETSSRAMKVLAEISKDENTLLGELAAREENLQWLNRQHNALMNLIPSHERFAWMYSYELWLYNEFEELEAEREEIHRIARGHRREVFQWAYQKAA